MSGITGTNPLSEQQRRVIHRWGCIAVEISKALDYQEKAVESQEALAAYVLGDLTPAGEE